eukprot:scaffold360127_cov42-Prasinocladus_malaysianus.AAC.1
MSWPSSCPCKQAERSSDVFFSTRFTNTFSSQALESSCPECPDILFKAEVVFLASVAAVECCKTV